MEEKRPKYIEGVGWRYETEHRRLMEAAAICRLDATTNYTLTTN